MKLKKLQHLEHMRGDWIKTVYGSILTSTFIFTCHAHDQLIHPHINSLSFFTPLIPVESVIFINTFITHYPLCLRHLHGMANETTSFLSLFPDFSGVNMLRRPSKMPPWFSLNLTVPVSIETTEDDWSWLLKSWEPKNQLSTGFCGSGKLDREANSCK